MAERHARITSATFSHGMVRRNKRRTSRRSLGMELLESRQLLATGPQLVGINPNGGELLNNGDTRHVAPRELTFRFDGNQVIDASTLNGIIITRTGKDGQFDVADAMTDLGTNGQALVRFEAATRGPSGNGISILLQPVDLGAQVDPIVTVEDEIITVQVNTNAQNLTTALGVVTAINRHPEARSLVVGSVESGSNGAVVAQDGEEVGPIVLRGANEAEATTDFGTGGTVQIRFSAIAQGPEQNGSRIAFRHAQLTNNSPPQVAVIGGVLTFTLNVTQGNETTVEQLLETVASHPVAQGRVRADLVTGTVETNIATPSMGMSDLVLDGATDVLIRPGFIGVDPNIPNQVVVRFAETLLDDLYSIDILGTGDTPLTNRDGEPFRDGRDFRLTFDLDLGAQVLAVVPQPVTRTANGTLQQARNQIAVYFNDDDLDPATVTDPDFYQLIFTNHKSEFHGHFDTVTNTDDQLFLPSQVDYDPDTDMALLTFSSDLEDLAGGVGTFRLRIGTDERFQLGQDELRLPPVPANIDAPLPLLVSDLGTSGAVEVAIQGVADHGAVPRLLITAADRGGPGAPKVRVFGNVIGIELNSNAAHRTTVRQFVDALNRHANHLVNASINSGNQSAFVPIPTGGQPTIYDVPGAGSSFATATDLGTLGVQSWIVSSAIEAQDYPLEFPGPMAEPGHRAIPNQNHYLAASFLDPDARAGDSQTGITTLAFNFREDLGVDPAGNPLFNLITEAQKERAREIFEIYATYLGIQFVETPSQGLTIATGDLRALDPTIATGPGGVIGLAGGGLAIMDNAEQWNDTFGASDDPQRFSWFDTAMHEIGHLLGLGHTDELGPFTVMNSEPELQFDTDPEDVFPGDHDLVHGMHLHRPESKDIDLYQFDVTEAGLFTAETIAERQENSSFLDTSLNLYRENPDGSRQLIATNDDYFSEDSLIRLQLTPGTYFVGVSASGNTQYDPDRQDSGLGGTSQGNYDLRLNFRPHVNLSIVDTTGTAIDGDADGVPGGVFNFWFRAGTTLFVDKLTGLTKTEAAAMGGSVDLGSEATPYKLVNEALADAAPGEIVRVIGNGGDTTRDRNGDGQLDDGDLLTLGDNLAYEVGFDSLGRTLSDGTRLDVPRGVTMMVDAGAIFKMRRSFITVGSTAVEIDRSGSALQILGTPKAEVIFTSYNNESIGVDTDTLFQTPRAGDWGGLLIQHDLDRVENRFDYERQGIFLNTINYANLQYGGGRVVTDSLEQVVAPIHLVDARPTISYNTFFRSADAAISANPDSFAETNFHAPLYQATPFTADYDRVGPDVHGNRLLNNSINALFVRIATPAGNELERMTVAGRWDDTDIVHVVSENLVIHATPGGQLADGVGQVARLDASLTVDPGIIVKLDGAGIETHVSAQLLAEGQLGHEIIFTSVNDDRYGAGATFDTGNNGNDAPPQPGDWTGLYFKAASQGSLDRAIIAYGGGVTKVGGTFAGFNAVEIHQAEVRMTNSLLDNNANGSGGQSRRNRDGRGRNAEGAIYVVGAQPVLLNNTIRNTSHGGTGIAPAININANALNSRLVTDRGRMTGEISLERMFRDNQGPLIRGNRLVNNDINGMVVRGATLTTQTVWDDTDIVHVVFDTIYVPDFHTFGGLRLESSATESLVVKLSGETAGFTATGRPLDIDDRIGGSIQIVGQPGQPVVLTSLADGSVGAGATPQNNTANDVVPGRSLPAGSFRIDINFGPTIAANPTVVASIERAAAIWESIIQDPVQVTLDVEFGAVPGGTTGFAVNENVTLDYGLVRNALINDAGAHEAFINDLPLFSELQALLPGGAGSSATVLPTITMSRANALALGIDPELLPNTSSMFQPTEVRDGVVTISDQSDIPGADVFGTAMHEIGHALGFSSMVDASGLAISMRPLDLFRLAPGAGAVDFRNSPRVLDPTQTSVFYDGGLFRAAGLPIGGITDGDIPLSTGDVTGDGSQSSHWKSASLLGGVNIGTMGPSGGTLSDADKRAFDLIGWDVVSSGAPGQWRSIRLEQYSNDRNVEVVTEVEGSVPVTPDQNGNPAVAEFLGKLAPSERAGDENRRLGFEIHGFLNHAGDVDTYSFEAQAGTEVWFDIDRTTTSLDTILELVDASGKVLARSDNSHGEQLGWLVKDAPASELPGGVGLPLGKASDGARDFWGTNLKDAGMRVVLPGSGTSVNTYHIRVKSDGLSSGVYQMQIRLRQMDEVPGSTIRFADIRFATNGIEILGQPIHSPLLGEAAETTADNSTFVLAQPVGNVLSTERGALSIAGVLDNEDDVDWYQFDVLFDSVQSASTPGANQYASVSFDLDYADGFARANTSFWVFDADGQLVLSSRDGKITDDLAAPGKGDNVTDLSRGSAGVFDPFVGPVSLPVGNYFLAVTTSHLLPTVLDQFTSATPTQPLIRLEPVDSVQRVAEDHIGQTVNSTIALLTGDSATSTGDRVTTPILFGQNFAVYVPSGAKIVEGETVVVSDQTGGLFVFEFDSDMQTRPGNVPVLYRSDNTEGQVAGALLQAMLPVLGPLNFNLQLAGRSLVVNGPVDNIDVSTSSAMFVSRPSVQPYFLGDVNLWVGQAAGLPGTPWVSSVHMVDAFSGVWETPVGGFDEFHGDLALNPDENALLPESLFTFSQSSRFDVETTDENTGGLLQISYQTGATTLIGEDGDGVETYELDGEQSVISNDGEGVGMLYNAMTFGGESIVDSNRLGLFAVGNRGDSPTQNPVAPGNDYGGNILYEFHPDTGLAFSAPAIDRTDNAEAGEFIYQGAGTQILERGFIDTLFDAGNGTTVMRVVEATTLGANDTTSFDIQDGMAFSVSNGTQTVTFTMDSGPQARVDFADAATVLDGDSFTLNGNVFEFDTGPVIGVTSSGSAFVDGEVFSITDRRGVARAFEIDTMQNGIGAGNIAVDIQTGLAANAIANRIAQAINNGSFGVIATAVGNRVNLEGDAGVTGGTGVAGTLLIGDYGVSANAVPIPVEEMFGTTEIQEAIVDAVNTDGRFTAGSDLERVNFPDAQTGNFSNAPFMTPVNGTGQSTTTSIDFYAEDTAIDIAQRVANAINARFGATIATAQGTHVQLNGGTYGLAQAPFVLGGAAPGGVIRGMAFIENEMYAVSDAGGLWRVSEYQDDDGELEQEFINTVVDDDGDAVVFAGLTPGPADVEGGRYESLMFGIDLEGNLYAIDTAGILQPIFMDGRTSVPTGLTDATGLTFSPRTSNPWGRTTDRGEFPDPNDDDGEPDYGHGTIMPVTQSRNEIDNPDTPEDERLAAGATSLHFGGGQDGNYDAPGGTHGTVLSNSFSLAGYSASDQPVLYFNYFIDTEDWQTTNNLPWMQDSFRVYISTDAVDANRGEWILVGTNNDFTLGGTGNDELDPQAVGELGVATSTLLHDNADWRQARIPLDGFAGLDNLRMRIDFATAGGVGLGSSLFGGAAAWGNEGEELTMVDGYRIADGQAILFSTGEAFEFDLGYGLKGVDGSRIADGETLSINDGTNIEILEFDLGDGTSPGNIAVRYTSGASPAAIASAIAEAVSNSGLNIVPHVHDDLVTLDGAMNIIQSAPGGQAPGVTISGTPGVNPGAVALPVHIDMTPLEVKRAFMQVYADTFTGGNLDVIKTYANTVRVVGRAVQDPGPLSFDNALYGEDIYTAQYETVVTNPPGPGALVPAVRAMNNEFEGIYLDDFIIGFAGRGEMVTAGIPTTDTTFMEDENTPDTDILAGPYQLEIRRSPVYGVANGAASNPPQLLVRDFDVTQRLSDGRSVTVSNGSHITSGQTFLLGDGTRSLEVRYVNQDVGEGNDTMDDARPMNLLPGVPGRFVGLGAIGDNIVTGGEAAGVPGLDVDFFSVQLAANDLMTIDIDAFNPPTPQSVRSALDPVLRLFDAAGIELASSDDTPAPGEGGLPFFDSYISFRAPADGTYYVGVSRYPNQQYDPMVPLSGTTGFIPRVARAGMYRMQVDINGGLSPSANNSIITVGYRAGDDAHDIARRLSEAINGSQAARAMGITAGVRGGSATVDLFGDKLMVHDVKRVPAVEPNDEPADALDIGIAAGTTATVRVAGEIGDNLANGSPAGDIDLLRVPLIAGDTVRVQSLLDEIGTNVALVLTAEDPNGNLITVGAAPLDPPNNPLGQTEFDAEMLFRAPVTGEYLIGVQSAGGVGRYELIVDVNGGVVQTTTEKLFGDTNLFRDQGQLLIHSNVIRDVSGFGIVVDAAQRDVTTNNPHVGPPRVLREVNVAGFVPGVVVANNIIARSGQGGIRFAGTPSVPDQPEAAVPFGRILNNTLVGSGGRLGSGQAVSDVGIVVENNASPTLLNNIVANYGVGVQIDNTSNTTVLGGMLMKWNVDNDNTPNGLGDFPIILSDNQPLFVDPLNDNFYLDFGSRAIDSSVDSLEDRSELTAVRNPLGIPVSPILAPRQDVRGQLRVDDPDVDSPVGVGEDIFKDRGALERADSEGPHAVLLQPADNDAEGRDLNSMPTVVRTFDTLSVFTIRLAEGSGQSDPFDGVGADDLTVTSANVTLSRNGVVLQDGLDYDFTYDATNDIIILRSLAGVWPTDQAYEIVLNNSAADGIQDLANNALRPNQTDGTTRFNIILGGSTDFGDAPAPYPTRLADDGARHEFRVNFFLGAGVDSEPDGQPSPAATADTDDGVVFLNEIRTGFDASVAVTASDAGLLDAWIDWNADGDWDDPGEQIFTSEPLEAGANLLNFTVPLSTTPTVSFARFRFSSAGNLAPTGPADDGEVEDYRVEILDQGFDFGDAPDLSISGPNAYPTLLVSDGARHLRQPGLYLGALVDAEPDGQDSVNATGDGADEDGVVFPAEMTIFSTQIIEVTASAPGFLDAWIDFDQQNGWQDDDRIFERLPLVAGVNMLEVTLPASAVPGQTFARFRFSAEGVDAPTGLAPSGEVEDYLITLVQPSADFGDAPATYPTTLANFGARHLLTSDLRLGAVVDAEADGQPSMAATGDGADEDGVVFTEDLLIGTSVDIQVIASGNGLLDAWIDWDRNGSWDPSERIADSFVVIAGPNTLSINVPASAEPGLSFARFRLSSAGGLGPGGTALDGEVEDYEVVILAGSWHNAARPADVNDDGGVSPLDAIAIINEMTMPQVSDEVTRRLPNVADPPPFYDVSNDGFVSPLDAIIVINALPSSVESAAMAAPAAPLSAAAVGLERPLVTGQTAISDTPPASASAGSGNGTASSQAGAVFTSVEQPKRRTMEPLQVANRVPDPVHAEFDAGSHPYQVVASHGWTRPRDIALRMFQSTGEARRAWEERLSADALPQELEQHPEDDVFANW